MRNIEMLLREVLTYSCGRCSTFTTLFFKRAESMVRAMRSSSIRYLNTVSYMGFARYNFMINFTFLWAKVHHLFETGKEGYVFMRMGTTTLVAFPLSHTRATCGTLPSRLESAKSAKSVFKKNEKSPFRVAFPLSHTLRATCGTLHFRCVGRPKHETLT